MAKLSAVTVAYVLLVLCDTVNGQGDRNDTSVMQCPASANINLCTDCHLPDMECTQCQHGYLWIDYETCLRCPLNCYDCEYSSYHDLTVCTQCVEGFYIDIEQQCTSCIGKCQMCTNDWDCQMCDDGFHPVDNKQLTCKGCSAGCERCTHSADDNCLSCIDSYYFVPKYGSKEGRCKKCGDGCLECDSSEDCFRCNDGFSWFGDHCDLCITGCDPAYCETKGCSRCVDGYFVTADGLECKSCEACNNCVQGTGCTDCANGYIRNADNTCQPCPNTGFRSVCEQCSAGDTARVFIDGQCRYCPDHCERCTVEGNCDSCHDGYYKAGDGTCQSCHISCLTCHNGEENNCETCFDGYGVQDGYCKPCATVTGVTDCRTCRELNCLTCSSGFYITDTSVSNLGQIECRSCTTIEAHKSPNACVQCASPSRGRFVSLDKCIQCTERFGEQCIQCDRDECIKCSTGYYIHANGRCAACSAANCEQCDAGNPSVCHVCITDYYPVSGDCQACDLTSIQNGVLSICQRCAVDHCAKCDIDVGLCEQCMDGYTYQEEFNVCADCSAGCAQCSSPNTCLLCEEGYYLYNSLCQACGLNGCLDCSVNPLTDFTDSTNRFQHQCGRCAEGKYPAPTRKCFESTACRNTLCETCMQGTESICETCEDGRYLSDNNCFGCNGICRTCVGRNSNDCTSCRDGYHVTASGTCMPCENTDCRTCEWSSSAACTACYDGFFLSGTTCQPCSTSAHCVTCSSANQCLTCAAGRYLDTDNTCKECGERCGVCMRGDGTTTICLSCSSAPDGTNYLPVADGSCDYTCEGVTDCTECGDDGNCVEHKCVVGKFANSASMCVGCGEGCYKCASAAGCAVCDDGYYLSGSSCARCSAASGKTHCTSCSQNGATCYACETGYVPNSAGTACVEGCTDSSLPNCASCSDDEGCTSCDTGYGLVDEHVCDDCSRNCMTCRDPERCISCTPGYFLDTNTATCSSTKCVNHCAVCQDSTTCDTCLPGYYPSTTMRSCNPCQAGCLSCSDDATCTACDAGYLLQDTVCVECPSHCADCAGNAMECRTCEEGYTEIQVCLNRNALCSEIENCKDCSSGDCTSCVDGFILAAGRCYAPLNPPANNCIAESTSQCVRCAIGHFLDPVTKTCIGCDQGHPNDASYVCEDCAGSGIGTHQNVQTWEAVCADCKESCTSCTAAANCEECANELHYDGTACNELYCSPVNGIVISAICVACSDVNYQKEPNHRGLMWHEEQSACVECPRNCRSCASTTSCLECKLGFVWSETEGLCIECDFRDEESCSNCIIGNQGRYLDNGKCLYCIPNCIRCEENPTTCTECAPTHFLSDNACVSCDIPNISQDGCLSCQATNPQWEYNVHAWLIETGGEGDAPREVGCYPCPRGCARCTALNTCDQCFGDWYYYHDPATNRFECRECVAGCTHCDGAAAKCTACVSTHYLEGETCKSCDDADVSQSGCISCQSTYELWKTDRHGHRTSGSELESECFRCIPNCYECNHPDRCSLCQDHHYYVHHEAEGRYECAPCSNDCKGCSHDKECLDCFRGSYLTHDYKCLPCAPNCAICSTADPDGCIECNAGYCFDEADYRCVSSLGKECGRCRTTSDTLECVDCKNQYFFDKCSTCQQGTCESCPEQGNVCLKCSPGNFLSQEEGQEGTCSPCPSNCKKCSKERECDECALEHYWDPNLIICAPCIALCTQCRNSTDCDKCAYGSSAVVTNGKLACVPCPAGCTKCNSTTECTECASGYYMVVGLAQCNACPTGCDKCTVTTDDLELRCNNDGCMHGYAAIEGQCVLCTSISNCNDCSDINHDGVLEPDECTSCAHGYAKVNSTGECVACNNEGCSTCSSGNWICRECLEDYQLSDNHHHCLYECYACEGGDECGVDFNNETASVVLCENGCWSTREERYNTHTYIRGCNNELSGCSKYQSEMCIDYVNNETLVEDCHICCEGNLCNIETPQGLQGLAPQTHVSTLLLLLTSICYVLALLLF